MAKIIKCYNNRQNALIESPTGSGKTLALLASACGCVLDYKVKLGSGAVIAELQRNNNRKESVVECKCNQMKKLRIYYGTRTHTQISQVIKEYKRLPFGHESGEKQLKHTILASRERLCINEEVRKTKDLREGCKEACGRCTETTETYEEVNKAEACNKDDGKETRMGKCEYRENLAEYEKPGRKPNDFRRNIDCVFDIEDLVDSLKNLQICPYYASKRILYGDADIVFTPFNYLIDPMIRNPVNIDLENSIVILDEAHNIEDICRDAATFSFKESELRDAIMFFNISLSRIPKKFVGTEQKKILQTLRFILYRLLNFMTKLEPDVPKTVSIISPTLDSKIEENRKAYKCNISFAPQKRTSSISDETNKLLKNGNSEIDDDDFYDDKNFIMNESPANDVDAGKESRTKSIRSNFEAILNFWCMSPSVAFKDAFKDCRSVVLASGTLKPIETFKTELGLKFDCEMDGKQVIPNNQIFAHVVSKSSTGHPFKFNFENTRNPTLYFELMQTICEVCKTVPKGILVFVSSYFILNEILKRLDSEDLKWKNLKLDIENRKRIFYEERGSRNFNEMFQGYSETIKNSGSDINALNGAIMIAVFRGNVSEGIDFADDLARCVICVGIPFPNFKDELVDQKRKFNDFYCDLTNILSGDKWYQIQAYRALNQALGRCLRHKKDWGAILLFDERFLEQFNPYIDESKKISGWVRNILKSYYGHQIFMKELELFVNQRLKDTVIQPVIKEVNVEKKGDEIEDKDVDSNPAKTFLFKIPSKSELKPICKKLGIKYSEEAIKFWEEIHFKEIDLLAKNITTQKFKTKNFYRILSNFFTGKFSAYDQIYYAINCAFRDQLIADDELSSDNIQLLCDSYTVTEKHFEFMALFLPCRILIFDRNNKKIRKYGDWECSNDILTFVLSFFDRKYSVVIGF
uniref:DNA helicase n=1 Tax=Panagrolaimus davidi TaxID=227884 RepID=A0A914QFF2_9BILA